MTLPREPHQSRPEHRLFSAMYGGRRTETNQILHELTIQAENWQSFDSSSEPELCLPLRRALTGLKDWSERRSKLDAGGPLDVFLRYVVSTVPRYRALEARGDAITLDDFSCSSSDDFLASYREFFAMPYLSASDKVFKPTSGTTGDPFVVWYDLACFYELAYGTYGLLADIVPGLADAVPVGGLGAVQVTDDPMTWPASTVLTSLKLAHLRRRRIGLDAESDVAVVTELRSQPLPLLSGLATSLVKLAELDRQIPPASGRISPHTVFVSGENLFEDTRAALEEWFGCRVYNAYTSSEGGCMATDCRFGCGFHVQTGHCLLEVLHPDGSISAEGTGDLLVTNFTNWAMPFVRYKTGDTGTLRSFACECGYSGPTLVDLPGRETVSFKTQAGEVTARAIDQGVRALPVKQFQVIQEDVERFLVRWSPAVQCNDPAAVERTFAGLLRSFGDIEARFERVAATTTPGAKIRRYIGLSDARRDG